MARQKHRKDLKKKTKVKAGPSKTGGGHRPKGKRLPTTYPAGSTNRLNTLPLAKRFERVDQLMHKGQHEEALEIIEDILDDHPGNVGALGMGAYLYGKVGLHHESLSSAQEALEKMPGDGMLLNLISSAYIQLGHRIHALRTLREMERLGIRDEEVFSKNLRDLIPLMEEDIRTFGEKENLTPQEFEQATLDIENSQLALFDNDIDATVANARKAIEIAPNWSIAKNNLVFVLSQVGEGQEALQQARQTVEAYPEDFNALNNLVQALALSGQIEEGQTLKQRLLTAFEQHKERLGEVALYQILAQTLGLLEDDAGLYQLFKARLGEDDQDEADLSADELRYLAAAAWNLGHPDEARRYWATISQDERTIQDQAILAELDRPRPAETAPFRVPYFDMDGYIPALARIKLIVVDERDEGRSLKAPEMQAGYAELKPYYPIAKAFQVMLTLGNPIIAGAMAKIMLVIDAPELVQTLREFGQGVYGLQDSREEAIAELIEAGYLPEEGQTTIRFWSEESQSWEDLPTEFFNGDDEETDEKLL